MIMDPSLTDFPDYTNGYTINTNQTSPESDQFSILDQYSFNDQYSPDLGDTMNDNLFLPLDPEPANSSQSTTQSPEDTDFSETIKYISQILMEEIREEKPTMFYDPLGLQVTEKSFYEVLGEAYPYSADQNPHTVQTPDSYSSVDTSFGPSPSPSTSAGSYSSEGTPSVFVDVNSVSQFNRGQEEASKFLPKTSPLFTDRETSPNSLGAKKQRESDNSEEDERNNKQSAVYSVEEGEELSEMFDKVLLRHEVEPQPQPQPQPTLRGKKQQKKKKETVDLRTLLLLCAQAVSGSDTRTSHELLKQIRQNSSPLGDGSQRLAHCFANALEARLAGTGTGPKIYSTLLSKSSATSILKAYQLHLASIPYKKLSMFFANKMIGKVAANSKCLHIVDFGILYGFQWPILIQHLAERKGGPPKLRITGIEYPQKGFRPTERIEETGRRLEKYCKRFGVDFEYNAIASEHWETIRLEEIGIRSGEVLAVNCLMRFKNLLEETVEVNCPRNAVLKLVRKMNPAVFVQSIVNGAYNAPFFVTRFREALFHFSALFDALDVVIPRGNEERLMYEREFFCREVMNVIACESVDRIERPETYKQWQVRNMRAGFRTLPLDPEIMAKFRQKLKVWYHKDFVMDEDSNWLLQGWKGRIVYASSCWVPV